MRHGEVELRDAGRTLFGVLIQEGRAGRRRRELFAPLSIQWPAGGVGVLTEHYGRPEVLSIPERQPDGRITLQAKATDAIRAAVAAGKKYMSIEFRALAERRTAGGIREILRALVPDVALVSEPEYSQTAAEVRARTSYSTTIRRTKILGCKCMGQLGRKNVGTVEFGEDAFDAVIAEVKAETRTVSAIGRGAGDVIATTGNGLVLTNTRQGLGISIDPLDTEAGRRFRELADAGIAVYARPILDRDGSTFEFQGDTAVVSRAAFDFVLVKPTATNQGLDPLTPTEGRSAVIPWERRRLLL